MTKKLFLTFIAALLFSTFNSYAQNTKAPQPGKSNNAETGAIDPAAALFPQSFMGKWKGQLAWIVAGKPTQTFTMQLIIQPSSAPNEYTWQIIYGDSAKDNRPYLLKPLDETKAHWVIDERDGILLDAYVHGNSFHSAFTVQGNTIVNNYRVENDRLFVEFFSIQLDNKNRSGKGTEATPFVDSYQVKSYQTGNLLRMK